MLILVKFLLVLIIVAAILLPAFLLLASAIRYKRLTAGAGGWIILSAGLLLTILSLEVFYPLVLTLVLKMNAQELAEASLFLAYAQPVTTYLALLLLGIGLWIQSKRIGHIRDGAPVR